MILDNGVCTLFHAADVSQPGYMPQQQLTPYFQSWYGEIFTESSPVWPTEGRKELRVDARIRVLQCRQIRQNDVAVLMDVASAEEIPAGTPRYSIERVAHAIDDDGPTEISDLSLKEISP